MERSAAETSSEFVRWEEVHVSSGIRRREVYYHLFRRDGTSDLAVVGKEKSSTHMAYCYAFRDRSLLSISPYSYLLKLRSRKDVIDWLNSVVRDSPPHQSSQYVGGAPDNNDACKLDVETFKDVQLRKLGRHTKEFLWLGPPWTCRKKRRHYPSFLRNGIKISVHDFVYVLAEEDKRLVAYLEDMYQDSRGNKMVVVRWFHKIDEVGIVLSQIYNGREVLFSLCLQDLSIECIDGLATVLSPKHYEKFLNEAKHTQLEPFVCHRQFDNDDVKPFDITQVTDYWRQEIVRCMHTASPSKDPVERQPFEDGLKVDINLGDGVRSRPKIRLRRSKDGDLCLRSAKQESLSHCLDVHDSHGNLVGSECGIDVCRQKDGFLASRMPGKQAIIQNPPQHLIIGSQIEVLSQDSGLRGCWFRASIIKKHKDKVKVQYQDIRDAADEARHLEEWVLASKIAVPDPLGLRMYGRTTIRPTPPSNKGKVPLFLSAGTVVDVWWHDGWWEGIVLQKESEDKICVYFPGEKQELLFGSCDLRHSQEWWGNGWGVIKERPDLASSILYDLERKQVMVKASFVEREKAATCERRELASVAHNDSLPVKDEIASSKSQMDYMMGKAKESEMVCDLLKDPLLAQLKWKTSGKRKRRNSVQKLHYVGDRNSSSPETVGTHTFDSFYIPKSLKADHDDCKYTGDSVFSSSVVSHLTSLVMSR
ncbi:DUF724 domain-containing protein [Actinidia chinensis var. chinensis]|uniref:DUF724 domain-containing protein n=1 Tax=Actinidia chinensis var. chinensis TaxID=1590841 RepID=A0A2R6P3R9_ACTCC|nr:DUF724 domain-containing protein [Actinidia chinensis var. chinensis]